MSSMGPAAWMLLGYLVAAVPVGLLVGKLRGVDLRSFGSGNIGTTNAVRALGPVLGGLVLILDIVKAGAPLWFASRSPTLLASSPLDGWPQLWVAAVGLACVLGHIYPVYLRFRGGKGVACALGILGVLHWPTALATVLIYAQTLWLVRVSSVASLTALTSASAIACVAPMAPAYRVLILAMTAIIWHRHRQNLRELPEKLRAAGQSRLRSEPDPEDADPG